MSFSNDSRYFCGGRLFTIFSFSQSSLSNCSLCKCSGPGLFFSSNCKRKDYMALLVLEMGLKPSGKKPLHPLISQLPRTFTQFAGVICNFKPADNRTTGRYLLCAAKGAGQPDQCWSFPIDGSLSTYTVQQLPEVLPLQFSLTSHGEIPIKCSLLQFQLKILETA